MHDAVQDSADALNRSRTRAGIPSRFREVMRMNHANMNASLPRSSTSALALKRQRFSRA
jgi:hypothetical protein